MGPHNSLNSFFLSFLLGLLSAEASLVALYSVQRHGARNVLPKGLFLTEEDLIGGPTLLPQGQLQTYTAGAAFRSRYIDTATCGASSTCLPGFRNGTKYGVVSQPNVGFGNFDVYVRSSSLDRAILSGTCFFNGVFPPDPTAPTNTSYVPSGAQVVPLYTQVDIDDIIIRAYTKCDSYQRNLVTWYTSQEFMAKSRETEALRTQVQLLMPGTDTALFNWWNVYDAINVYQTYGVGNPVPTFNKTLFKQVQDLANWLETSKMRSSLTGNLLGGVALADVVGNFQRAAGAAANGSQAYYKLLSLSGHYNTQLGILAALEIDKWPAASNFTWLSSLPKLAAVMVFELHALQATGAAAAAAAGSFFVRLVFQDGPAASYATVPLPCASNAAAAALEPGACTLEDFLSYASARAINSAYEWCTACSTFSPSTCAAAQLAALEEVTGGGSCDSAGEAWKIAVSVVVTFVGTVLLGAVGTWLWHRRHGRQGGAPAVPAGSWASSGELKSDAEMMRYGNATGDAM